MNRIDQKFAELAEKGRKAFIAFVTAGDPDLRTTEELVLSFESAGVDLIELGVPFSDPIADGPTIQASSQRALQQCVTLEKIFQQVKSLRHQTQIPIVLMTSYNPVFKYGDDRFVREAKLAGVDGVIVPDLPPEEASVLIQSARQNDFSTIFFLSPTTSPDRMKKNIEASTGFVYFVSITGITGVKPVVPANILKTIEEAKKLSRKPICVGFGISTGEQILEITKAADGVIIGSAIVKEIASRSGQPDLVEQVTHFVRNLTVVLKQ